MLARLLPLDSAILSLYLFATHEPLPHRPRAVHLANYIEKTCSFQAHSSPARSCSQSRQRRPDFLGMPCPTIQKFRFRIVSAGRSRPLRGPNKLVLAASALRRPRNSSGVRRLLVCETTRRRRLECSGTEDEYEVTTRMCSSSSSSCHVDVLGSTSSSSRLYGAQRDWHIRIMRRYTLDGRRSEVTLMTIMRMM